MILASTYNQTLSALRYPTASGLLLEFQKANRTRALETGTSAPATNQPPWNASSTSNTSFSTNTASSWKHLLFNSNTSINEPINQPNKLSNQLIAFVILHNFL